MENNNDTLSQIILWNLTETVYTEQYYFVLTQDLFLLLRSCLRLVWDKVSKAREDKGDLSIYI